MASSRDPQNCKTAVIRSEYPKNLGTKYNLVASRMQCTVKMFLCISLLMLFSATSSHENNIKEKKIIQERFKRFFFSKWNEDVADCSVDNGGCEDICTDTNGSIACSCSSGYELGDDGLSCIDVNECSINNGGCDETCTNTNGSFVCSCPTCYELQDDKTSCIETSSLLTWHTVGDDYFVRFTQRLTWNAARELCQSYCLDLYHPKDVLAVARYLAGNYSEILYWVGGQGDGNNQVWVDGELVSRQEPWISSSDFDDVDPDTCMFIITRDPYPDEGAVLTAGPCRLAATGFLCG